MPLAHTSLARRYPRARFLKCDTLKGGAQRANRSLRSLAWEGLARNALCPAYTVFADRAFEMGLYKPLGLAMYRAIKCNRQRSS